MKVFPASVTMREIEVVMNEDADARLHKAARLQA